MYQNVGGLTASGHGQSRFIKYGKSHGLQYNPEVPPEAINKRPVYSYGNSFDLLSLQPALWLDANDSSTITLVDGAVSEWRDKSGNNLHATQTTAGNRPLLVADGLNGTDVIRFNGTTRLNLSYLATSQCTLFVVAKTNATSAWRCLGSFGVNLNFYINYNNANWGHYPSGDSGFNANSYSIMSIERTSTNIVYKHNANTPVNKSLTTYVSTSAIGAVNTTGTESGIFDLAQIIIFPRVLTQAEREQVEGYLAWSTGLQSNLPSNHPYKNINPSGRIITNISNWQLSYQKPKARVSYDYRFIKLSDDVVLYIRVKDGVIADISNNPVSLTLNGTTVSTTIERLSGKGSIYTNGTGGLITAVDSKFQLGNQDFTVEFWQYSPSGATNADHLSSRTSNNYNGFVYYEGNSYYSTNGSSWTNTITGTYSANTWNHITTTRQGSTLYYFINGVLQGTSSVGTNNIFMQSQIAVGSTTLNTNRVIAYYDDIRIIKGRALYTSNFSTNNIIEYP